jgi:hypothetical protein
MTAIIAHEATGTIRRLSEDFDSTPTATWVESWNGKKWDWSTMTPQPFSEVLSEFAGKGWIKLAEE